jgi:hypothetical protein
MPEDEEEIPFETHCDRIERELRSALEDLSAIRANKAEAKLKCIMLRAALGNARH